VKKGTLAFDIDGVAFDFFGSFLLHVNQKLGTSVTYDQAHSHDLSLVFGVGDQEIIRLHQSWQSENDLSQMPPIQEALEAIADLSVEWQTTFITARKPDLESGTWVWRGNYFPETDLHFAIGRNNVYGGQKDRLHKPQVAERIGAIALIEDNEQEFLHWDSDKVEPIIFTQPWNESLVQSHPHIARLNWPQILDRFLG